MLGAAREAFVGGMHTAAWASAGIMLFAAVIALAFLRGLPATAPETRSPRPADKVPA